MLTVVLKGTHAIVCGAADTESVLELTRALRGQGFGVTIGVPFGEPDGEIVFKGDATVAAGVAKALGRRRPFGVTCVS